MKSLPGKEQLQGVATCIEFRIIIHPKLTQMNNVCSRVQAMIKVHQRANPIYSKFKPANIHCQSSSPTHTSPCSGTGGSLLEKASIPSEEHLGDAPRRARCRRRAGAGRVPCLSSESSCGGVDGHGTRARVVFGTEILGEAR